jgi:hypothetical protein
VPSWRSTADISPFERPVLTGVLGVPTEAHAELSP